MPHFSRPLVAVAAVVLFATSLVIAHEMTIKGTVEAVDAKRIQVKTGTEAKNQPAAWYPLDAKTKILRGKTTVTFDAARITPGELAVLIVDHQTNGTMRTLEVRLAAK